MKAKYLKVKNNYNWTTIITSKRALLDVDLKGLWEYRELIAVFVKRDIVSIYKQTVLGPIWFLFGPLFTVFTYTFAFNTIAKIPTDGIPAPVFYLAGTVLWNYFQACFNGVSMTLKSNANIFGKVYFPRLVTPISILFSNLLKFSLQFIVFLCFIFYYNSNCNTLSFSIEVLLLPLMIFILGMLAMGWGLIISAFSTKYRDLTNLIGVFLMLLMYASPIIYPSSSVPAVLKPYLVYNPISPLIDCFRYAFTGAGSYSLNLFLYSFFISLFSLFIGVVLFNKAERNFVDTV